MRGSSVGSSGRLGHLVLLSSAFSTGAGFFCRRSRRYSARLSDLGLGSGTTGPAGGRASLTGGIIWGVAGVGAAAGLSEDMGGRTAEGTADETSSFSGASCLGIFSGCRELTVEGEQLGGLFSGLAFKDASSCLGDTGVATCTFI